MKTLTINAGSSSIKFRVFDAKLNRLAAGILEKIGEPGAFLKYEKGESEIKAEYNIKNHEQGMKLIVNHLLAKDFGVIADITEVKNVGHRVVHGGNISKPSVINANIIKAIEKNAKIAPLHNPANLMGIKVARKIFSKAKHVAVFDTAFHQTIPEHAHTYGLPYKYYRAGIRKYGFHGISHEYLAGHAAAMLRKPASKLNVITCHLGAGCSVAAIKGGKSVDTSMGFTPLEGLMMSTRSGDFDPAIVHYMVKNLRMNIDKVYDEINNASGLLGVSGVSKDMRELLAKAKSNKRAKLALDMFVYRVQKYIGAYTVALGRVDAIVFSGGIGGRSSDIRAMVCDGLAGLGVKVDRAKNKKAFDLEMNISGKSSKIKIIAMPTNEGKMIAEKCRSI